MLLPYEAILHGLASIYIGSSFFSRDYISSLRFLRGIHNIFGYYAFTSLDLVTLLMLFATKWKLTSNE